jgi:hypothetical protein
MASNLELWQWSILRGVIEMHRKSVITFIPQYESHSLRSTGDGFSGVQLSLSLSLSLSDFCFLLGERQLSLCIRGWP